MALKRPSVAIWLLWPALCCALLLGGCGDDESSDSGSQAPDWSDPAGKRATGSPDGDGGTARTAASLLEDLLERVRSGQGPQTAGFARAVESVAAVIWDPAPEGADMQAAQMHQQIAVIAGEIAQWLAKSEGAREVHLRRDPTAVGLHDAWIAAASKGVSSYAEWCGGAGATLLRERAQALQERFFPKKK